jgi:hypothetical protein
MSGADQRKRPSSAGPSSESRLGRVKAVSNNRSGRGSRLQEFPLDGQRYQAMKCQMTAATVAGSAWKASGHGLRGPGSGRSRWRPRHDALLPHRGRRLGPPRRERGRGDSVEAARPVRPALLDPALAGTVRAEASRIGHSGLPRISSTDLLSHLHDPDATSPIAASCRPPRVPVRPPRSNPPDS